LRAGGTSNDDAQGMASIMIPEQSLLSESDRCFRSLSHTLFPKHRRRSPALCSGLSPIVCCAPKSLSCFKL